MSSEQPGARVGAVTTVPTRQRVVTCAADERENEPGEQDDTGCGDRHDEPDAASDVPSRAAPQAQVPLGLRADDRPDRQHHRQRPTGTGSAPPDGRRRVWLVRGSRSHPFADRWNHNTHYFPLLAARIPATTDRVLDVGCGDGTFCRFVSRDGRQVVGLDVDPSVLPADSAGVQYVNASAESLPFDDGTFGAVTMTMVLHHVEAERALAEAARVLAPGGVLLVLGYGRYGGWRDAPHEARDLLAHRMASRRMRVWDPPTDKAEPSGTWAQARAAARDALPGSTYHRLAMWRYLVEWSTPRVSGGAGPA